MSTPELVDAEIIDHKVVGQNFVLIRLPDGPDCKVTLQIVAYKLKDQKNPDGTPIFRVNVTPLHEWKWPAGRMIRVPKPPIATAEPKNSDRRLTI